MTKKLLPITDNPWKRQSTKKIFENPWLSLHEDKVTNPGGGISHYGKIKFKNFAIGIIPLDKNNNTWLVGQYRYVPDCYSWEIPMGGGPLAINPLQSAKRELKEETGLIANDWQQLMKLHTSNSVTDERGLIYVARDLTQAETAFEETEELLIQKIPLDEAIERVLNGEITDAISAAGLLKLKLDHVNKPFT
ncbi:ADP-ribose pyrophosphatase [hydrothermal vent metagenome]|uniref:ADP-ribose pyrophosphatase n=1 Tax=hydrothermal vent metagenome TaxID=652676 RepID=A0A3B0X4H6_9ZZZZ